MDNYSQFFGQESTLERGIFNALEVDANSKMNLSEAAKWAKFLGIINLILIVLAFLTAIVFFFLTGNVFSDLPELQNLGGLNGSSLLVLLYIIPGLIILYPTVTFIRFGNLTRAGIKNNNQAQFNKGLLYLKKSLKFMGILVIILIGMYVLVVIAMIAGRGFSGIT